MASVILILVEPSDIAHKIRNLEIDLDYLDYDDYEEAIEQWYNTFMEKFEGYNAGDFDFTDFDYSVVGSTDIPSRYIDKDQHLTEEYFDAVYLYETFGMDVVESYRDCFGVIPDSSTEISEAYIGYFESKAEFAEDFCKDDIEDIPNYIVINWEDTADYITTDWIESNGYYFRNI